MNVVISQPMFFPWVGMFEQIRLADCYVIYNDVQFSRGSFVNRVQIKTAAGPAWMTVPLQRLSLGQKINQVEIDTQKDWRRQHLDMLRQAYASALFLDDMLSLVREVYAHDCSTIGELSVASTLAACRYFGLDTGRRFCHIGDLAVPGRGSQRVLDIIHRVGGDRYVTGLGASQYLEHETFEFAGINVQYMDYAKTPYPQLHGDFTPYVSVLDLIANVGAEGRHCISSGTKHWRAYLQQA